MPGHSQETLDTARTYAAELSLKMSGCDIPSDVAQLAQFIASLIAKMPNPIPASVTFGYETAIADVASKVVGLPLCRWLSGRASGSVAVNALLPSDIEALRRVVPDFIRRGYTTYKIKVGTGHAADDIALLRAAREELGNQVRIRIDANRAWDFDTALHALKDLSVFDIEYVEEPLRSFDLHRLGELHNRSTVAIAIDETVVDRTVWNACIRTDGVVAAVVKPTVIGGLTECIRLIGHVASIGKKAVITTCFESAVGTAACLHMAAAQSEALLPSGLDTLRFLSDTLCDFSFAVERGRMTVPQTPGLGVEPRVIHGC
jgi:o-succinylbenzoate synthase